MKNFSCLGIGKSDGTIVAYLSAEKAEDGIAIYYIEHDDGDQEDVDVLTATKAVNYHLEGERVLHDTFLSSFPFTYLPMN